jgi:hypothetical protein
MTGRHTARSVVPVLFLAALILTGCSVEGTPKSVAEAGPTATTSPDRVTLECVPLSGTALTALQNSITEKNPGNSLSAPIAYWDEPDGVWLVGGALAGPAVTGELPVATWVTTGDIGVDPFTDGYSAVPGAATLLSTAPETTTAVTDTELSHFLACSSGATPRKY